MNTTAIIIEVLVIGYTSLLWIVPLLLAHFDLTFPALWVQVDPYKEWAPVVALILTAVAYQIGWLLDYFSFLFFYYVGIPQKSKRDEIHARRFWRFYFVGIGRKRKREWIPDGQFWRYYNIVCQEGSQAIHEMLRKDLSIIRLTRSGVVNFLLIGMTMLFLLRSWAIFTICLGISVACFVTMRKWWGHYYEKIKVSYDYLVSQAVIDG